MALMAIWQFRDWTAYCPKTHVLFIIVYRIYGKIITV